MIPVGTHIQEATGYQVAKLADKFTTAIRGAGFRGGPFQEVLNQEPDILTPELLSIVHKHVEGGNTTMVYRIQVDRSLSQSEVVASIGGHQHVSPEVADTIPLGLGEDVDLRIIGPSSEHYQEGRITSVRVAQLYGLNRLTPDPRALAKAITSHPLFRDGRHYAVQWQVEGVFFFLSACYYKDEWYVHVGVSPDSWGEEWSFVGVEPVNMDPHF